MINIKIPTPPNLSDFYTDEDAILNAEKVNEVNQKRSSVYAEKNTKISNVFAFVVLSIISGLIINSYKPSIDGFALIFLASSCGFLTMFPVGCILTTLFEDFGKEIEPNKRPNNDEYVRADAYIRAKNKYEYQMEAIKRDFPKIDNFEFDVKKYNDYLVQIFKQRLDRIICNERVSQLRKEIGIWGEIIFANLDLIGCKNIKKINYDLYSAELLNESVLVTYMKSIERGTLDEFIKIIQNNLGASGVIITDACWHDKEWYMGLIRSHNIRLYHIDAFEQIVVRNINRTFNTLSKNPDIPEISTPFEAIDFTYVNDGKRRLYSGFTFELVKEVFTSKKDIYEKIVNTPKEEGAYGILKYSEKQSKTIYGLVFFRDASIIDYYKNFLCAAVDNKTKKYSNIVYDYSYRGYERCRQYKFESWSDCYEESYL